MDETSVDCCWHLQNRLTKLHTNYYYLGSSLTVHSQSNPNANLTTYIRNLITGHAAEWICIWAAKSGCGSEILYKHVSQTRHTPIVEVSNWTSFLSYQVWRADIETQLKELNK